MSLIHEEHFREAQKEERLWWGNCANTFHEEEKQFVYAKYMGLEFERDDHTPYSIRKDGLRILDIGGGPSSLLLKTKGFISALVVDPCDYPDWVTQRYKEGGIEQLRLPAELLDTRASMFDEVWMYNCLQHAQDPGRIIENGLKTLVPGGVFRIFEWINTPVNEAHPHSLTAEFLDDRFNSFDGVKPNRGVIMQLAEAGCYGTSYSGVFTKDGPLF